MNRRLLKSTPQETFYQVVTFRWAGRVGLVSNAFAIGMLVLGGALIFETHPMGLGRYLRAAFGQGFDPSWYGYLLVLFALATFGRRFKGVEVYIAISPLAFYQFLAIFITLRYPSVERITVALVPWLMVAIFTVFYVLEQTDAHFVHSTEPTDTDS